MTKDLYQSLVEGDDNSSKKQLDDYLTEKEVAIDYPIYTVNSLRFFRSTQRSIFPYHKVGRKVFYKREDIENALANTRVVQLWVSPPKLKGGKKT